MFAADIYDITPSLIIIVTSVWRLVMVLILLPMLKYDKISPRL